MVISSKISSKDKNTEFWLQSALITDDVLASDLGQNLASGFDIYQTLNGDTDHNKITGGTDNDLINGNAGNDTLIGGEGHDQINGGTGNDRINGGNGHDKIHGDSGNDRIDGGAGDDVLYGDAGYDKINGGAGNDYIDGGVGNDTIIGGEGHDFLYGGKNHDQIKGGAGDDLIDGGAENDTLSGGEGNDILYGNKGNDKIKGDAGDDRINGGHGHDTLNGGHGHDILHGGADSDRLDGSVGNDTLYGEDGYDTLYGGAGDDYIEGGTGNDFLNGGEGNDVLNSGEDHDQIRGNAGDDYIDGGAGNDTLKGDAGHDQITAGAGDDRLDGGAGNDTLEGGAGRDRIKGGAGNDTFVLTPDYGFNEILDFKDGEDKIKLAGGLAFGNLEISSQGAKHTIIKNLLTGENIAKLRGVHSEAVDVNDFVHDEAFNYDLEFRSLDGKGNNLLNETLGQAGNIYRRVGDANYVNGDGIDNSLPNARFVSNRVFNDLHVNLFSENNASHLVFVWGQFLDHTFGLAQGGTEAANIAFNNNDPLEDFRNDFGGIGLTRSEGKVVDNQREQINTVSSFIDGWAIYGGTEARLEWLREGPVDGDLSNNSAKLLLPNGYLPTADARGDHTTAPGMDLMSRLRAMPETAIIAGDVRANENTGLTATHTLFAREHNRIVDLLPDSLDEESKFQIARKVVTAEQQYITYNEYLPSIGIKLDNYEGYQPDVDPSLTNEFATVGYRAHSMVHGDFDFDIANLSDADIALLESQGALVDGDQIEVPVNTQSGNPMVVEKVGLGPVIEGLFETNYNNDAQIDNQLRSILFQVPIGGGEFTDGPPIENLFNAVVDLGAIDIQRGRDHGMSFYNDMRVDYGLDPVESFYEITGEDPEKIKKFINANDLKDVDGTKITAEDLMFNAQDLNLDDPSIIDFIAVLDGDGEVVADPQEIAELLAENEEVEGVSSIQRSTVAARLEAIYGDVNQIDAFTAMVAEAHLPGSEFGELQQAIWKEQFEDLRDGDRFFYLNDPDLAEIKTTFGIDYQHSLGDIIANNTDLDPGNILENVFITEPHV